MICIKNAKLVLENGILWDGALLVSGDRIVDYGRESQLTIPEDAQIVDAGGLYVGPGFVDIHVHGGGGANFHEDPEQTAGFYLNHGQTTVLATTYTDMNTEKFCMAIRKVRHAMETGKAGKAIGGFYMEGPYMNPKYGADSENNPWRGAIREEDYKRIVDEAGELVKVWAIAPERTDIAPFLQYAKQVNPGVMFAVGHSEATTEQIEALRHYGIGLKTHCMDATAAISDWEGTRGCGPDEDCLLDSNMYAEVICDSQGIHVNPGLIRLILKNKGLDKVVLITDGTDSEGEAPEALRDIKDLRFDSMGRLSGSKLTMDQACRNMMTHTNCGIAQAFIMAARNPARVIGMGNEIGTIAVGKRANLVLVSDSMEVKSVMLNGQFWKEL